MDGAGAMEGVNGGVEQCECLAEVAVDGFEFGEVTSDDRFEERDPVLAGVVEPVAATW